MKNRSFDGASSDGARMEEQLITRIKITNRTGRTVRVAERYAPLFHGSVDVGYGVHECRYSTRDVGRSRLVTSLQKEYPCFKVDVGAAGLEVM